MLCFRDMTFCSSVDCINTQCMRNFSPEQQDRANRWWGGPGAPIAFSDFETGCKIKKVKDGSNP